MADLLSRLEILQDKGEDQPGLLPVRVMRVQDSGECDPFHERNSCPHGELLLVVSAPGEGPRDAVAWRTPRRIGWDFVKWLESGKIDPANSELGEVWFQVRDCEAPPEVENGHVDPRKGGWWTEALYEIHLGHEHASMKALPPPRNDHCDLY